MVAPDVSHRSLDALLSLDGRGTLITGGARGVGLAIAHRFAEAGASVAIGDVDQASLNTAAGELARHDTAILAVPLDVRSTASVEQAVDMAAQKFGGLSVLVNNAGIYPQQLLRDTTDEFWDGVLAVNLSGPMRCARAAYRHLCKAAGNAVIVNVLSTAAFSSKVPGNGTYSAAKFGLNGLTRAQALQFGPDGIRVLGVAPTAVDTPGMAELKQTDDAPTAADLANFGAHLPLGRAATPDDIARVVLFCASDMSMMMTGSALLVDGGALI